MSADPRADALAILAAGVAAAEPRRALEGALRRERGGVRVGAERVRLPVGARVHLVAAGKAAAAMAAGAAEILAERVGEVSVVVPRGGARGPVAGVEPWTGGHPYADAGSLAAAADALRVARAAGEEDLLLCLLSGGASALWGAPLPGLTLDDLRGATSALSSAGVEIGALNVVRRALTALGGGKLAAATRARVATLALSDVIGSAPGAIGSGPTVPEAAGPEEPLAVARGAGVTLPPRVTRFLEARERSERASTAPRSGPYVVIADNDAALAGAEAEARRRGYEVERWPEPLHGEARHAGRALAERVAVLAGGAPRALLAGGETTVTVRGRGVGGRSQELALAAALSLDGDQGVVLAAQGSDGIDGPTAAAGGVVDGGTAARARGAGLDPRAHLRENDAHTLLRVTGDLIVTGPTGTNVGDLVVGLAPGRG